MKEDSNIEVNLILDNFYYQIQTTLEKWEKEQKIFMMLIEKIEAKENLKRDAKGPMKFISEYSIEKYNIRDRELGLSINKLETEINELLDEHDLSYDEYINTSTGFKFDGEKNIILIK